VRRRAIDRVKDLRLSIPLRHDELRPGRDRSVSGRMYREEARPRRRAWLAGGASVQTEAEIDDASCGTISLALNSIHSSLNGVTPRTEIRSAARSAQFNFFCGDALLDARLDRRWPGRFDVVVTNPPYLSARNVSRRSRGGGSRNIRSPLVTRMRVSSSVPCNSFAPAAGRGC